MGGLRSRSPEGLERVIADAGFENREKWLVIDASAAPKLERQPGTDVRQVRTEEDLASYLAVAREALTTKRSPRSSTCHASTIRCWRSS